MFLYPMLTADALKTLTKSSRVRKYHVNVAFGVTSCGVGIGAYGVVVFVDKM